MIISNKYQFAFMHIPKCAGSSVRQALQRFDQTGGKFNERVAMHPTLGLLDYTHIPLALIRKYFPEEYESIKLYDTFAVIRDPFSRFPSSVAQHLQMYGNQPLHALSDRKAHDEIKRITDYLTSRSEDQNCQCSPEYVHFRRQVDYVYDDGEQLISNLYTVNNLGSLYHDIAELVGEDQTVLESSKATMSNQRVVYRGKVVYSVVESIRYTFGPIWRTFLPQKVVSNVRQKLTAPAPDRYNSLFDSGYIHDFIEEYYHADFALFSKVKNSQH